MKEEGFAIVRLALILGGALCLALPSFGETSGAKPSPSSSKKMLRPTKVRQLPKSLASIDPTPSSMRTRATFRKVRTRDFEMKIGLAVGYATSSTNNLTNQSLRDTARFDRNAYLGIVADARIKKYAGVELDAFFNVAPSRDVRVNDVVQSRFVNQSKSLQQYGAMLGAKGQVPFYVGNTRWVPKLGAGYGILGLSESTLQLPGQTEATSNTLLNGPYAQVGFDVDLFRTLSFGVDYARSFVTSGRVNDGQPGGRSLTTEYRSSHFDRLRVSSYVRLADAFVLGGQYVRRQLNFELPTETVEFRETLDQFLALFMVSF